MDFQLLFVELFFMRAIYEDILLWSSLSLCMGSSSWFIPAPAISCGAQTTLGTLKQVVWLGAGQGAPEAPRRLEIY